jgi:hypothetical protein
MEPTIVGKDVVFSEHVSRHLFKIEKWVCHSLPSSFHDIFYKGEGLEKKTLIVGGVHISVIAMEVVLLSHTIFCHSTLSPGAI